jgi:hypothetical protein
MSIPRFLPSAGQPIRDGQPGADAQLRSNLDADREGIEPADTNLVESESTVAKASSGTALDGLADFVIAAPPPAEGIPDPEKELAAYRSNVQVDATVKRSVRITALQIRKPNDQEYIRVMPGVERILPLFKNKADGDKLYLFKREVEPFLPPRAIRPYRIVLAKSLRALVPFVWPVPVPQDDMGRTWHESADAAAREAESKWVKIVADMVGDCYVTYPAVGALPDPEWPAESHADLILLAFKNQRIDTPDHPVIRRLNGELV